MGHSENNFRVIMENKGLTDFNPIFFGRDRCQPNQHFIPTIREYYLIHFVISGKGKFRLRNTWYSITANQMFIIPISTENFYQADEKDPWEFIWIAFTGNLAEHFSQLPPVMNFSGNIFYEMLEVRNLNAMREEFIAEKLFSLYRFLLSKYSSTNYTAAVKNYIQNNYMESTVSVEQIAQSLGLNRIYLSRMFKQEYNCSIQEYLIRTRITHAISFLNMEYDIQWVARLVGYPDASNFSKIFKKYIGVSPKKYQTCSKNKTANDTCFSQHSNGAINAGADTRHIQDSSIQHWTIYRLYK